MTHDPLCPEPDYPIARKCPSCWNYSTVREDMLAKCIAAVEASTDRYDFWEGERYATEAEDGQFVYIEDVTELLRALQENNS